MREGGWILRKGRKTIAYFIVVVQLRQFDRSVLIYPQHYVCMFSIVCSFFIVDLRADRVIIVPSTKVGGRTCQ